MRTACACALHVHDCMLTACPPPYLSQVPPEWFCPLSKLLMLDPVCLMDGVSYNSAALEEWLATKGSVNPATGAPLEVPVLCTP